MTKTLRNKLVFNQNLVVLFGNHEKMRRKFANYYDVAINFFFFFHLLLGLSSCMTKTLRNKSVFNQSLVVLFGNHEKCIENSFF